MTVINLQKGGRINLSKEASGMSRVRLGLSWDANAFDSGDDFDLDVSIFANRLRNIPGGEPAMKLVDDAHFVFYNSEIRTLDDKTASAQTGAYPRPGKPCSPCLGIIHSGDNTTGAGAGDDESVNIDFNRINPAIEEIAIVVTIHDAAARKQNFGQVSNARIKLYDEDTGEVVAKYDLDDDFSSETAVQFGSLYRKDGSWLFRAIGKGYTSGLQAFVNGYRD